MILLLAAVLLAILCVYRINKLYLMRVQSYASNEAVRVINEAVGNVLDKNPQYDGFVHIFQSSDNKVMATEGNTVLMNRFKSELTLEIQRLFESAPPQTVSVPMGSIFGVAVFNNCGVKIPVRLAPVSSVKTDFFDELENSGINNTKHSLNIRVETELAAISYFSQTVQYVNTTVPVSETLIAGDVPTYFSDSGYIGYIPKETK